MVLGFYFLEISFLKLFKWQIFISYFCLVQKGAIEDQLQKTFEVLYNFQNPRN